MRRAIIAFLALGSGAVAASAETIWISTASSIMSFDSAAPGTILSTVSVSGLAGGDTIAGIDFRPATGQLYALGGGGRLYTVNRTTGNATQVGTTPITLSGTAFGFDFNPTVDRIRVVSNSGQNLRLHPDTGAIAFTDTALAFNSTDPNAGDVPAVVGAGYTNSIAGATTTTLYDVERGNGVLVTQVPPNNGVLNTVGTLGITLTDTALGFDISSRSGTAYLAADTGSGLALYTVTLSNGSVTPRGAIAGDPALTGLAVALSEGNCVPSTTALCLNDDRFRVTTTWTRPDQVSGPGIAVRLTNDTGYFWFFGADNVELLVKALDACVPFDRYWVFAGGVTNVAVVTTVTDTNTGAVKTYTNPQGTPFQPMLDANAFATCP
jgi:hypothetical protein